jgi:hypothetical protein
MIQDAICDQGMSQTFTVNSSQGCRLLDLSGFRDGTHKSGTADELG